MAQNEMFRTYTINDGLPENTANVLLQDSKGQIWVGTQAGVSIFDGVRFRTIGTEGEEGMRLSNNMVEGLYEDSNGLIYIGTRNGMNVYNPQSQKLKIIMPDTTTSFGNNFCRPGFFEDEQFVWFISRFSLFKIDKKTLKTIKQANFAPIRLSTMTAYNDGFLLSADSSVLFYKPQENSFKEILSLPHNISSISIINHQVWISTYEGIYDITGNKIIEELQLETITYIEESSDGKIWIGTTKGIAVYNGQNIKFIRSNSQNAFDGNLQLSFLEDKNKVLWFGTNSALNMLIPLSEKIEKNVENKLFHLASSQIYSIAYSNESGLIAFGTEEGVHISKLDTNSSKISVTEYRNFLKEEPINFVNTDVLGRIWVGTKSGEVHCFQEDFSHFQLSGNIKGIRGFYYDTINQQIYIAGSEGLFVAHENRKIYQPYWLKEINYTVSILNRENEFWVSHSDFIYHVDIDQKEINKDFYPPHEIPSYMISHQLKTDSCYWLSSISGGVFSYFPKEDSWATYNILKGKNIWSTHSDSMGRFWSNSDDGIYIHNGLELIQKLDAEDGLNYNDFNMSAQCQLKNGALVYGNRKGLSIIDPKELQFENWKAKPFISGLEINFKSEAISRIKEILLLEPEEKSIAIKIGLDDFLFSKDAEISYKIDKLNSNWSTYTPINYPISLNGLSSGKYILQVKVKDKSGRVSNQILTQSIKVLPYFYETTLFKVILFVILAMIFVFIANFRARQKQKAAENKLKTERAINSERERISRDLHDSIGARLTKIISDLDIMELQTEMKQKPISIEELSKTRDYTQDTINNLRETIWTLDAKIVRLQDIFHQSKKYIERYLPENIAFVIEMEDDLYTKEINPEVAVNIFRIIQELTQNMLKYSKATKFSVNFIKDKNFRLIVQDNGIGFNFEESSKGEGLKNIQKRLDEIKGELVYENLEGSTFIIRL
jgi:signal transduction histidine kinase/ligand-binding sensor domain-containing protein